jgi:D-glycero-alpha-D-manno-heptose-7-phosphate kinase
MNHKKVIYSKAPLRLGLAGGGTDVSPFCDDYGGSVLNITINLYAYSKIESNEGSSITNFESSDLQITECLPLNSKNTDDFELKLHLNTYRYFIDNYNQGKDIPMKLFTYCEAPRGSGLGSSSTVVVSMCKAFDSFFNIGFDSYELAEVAFYIERTLCNFSGGKQDQFSAAFGGFNFMEFGPGEKTIVNQLKIQDNTLNAIESSLVIYFSGISRDSDRIINNQKESVKKNKKSFEALKSLKSESVNIKNMLLKDDINSFFETFKKGWELKKQTAPDVTNDTLESIMNVAYKNGAICGKVSGAGGGGFMMFFSDINDKCRLINALNKLDGNTFACQFTSDGAVSW